MPDNKPSTAGTSLVSNLKYDNCHNDETSNLEMIHSECRCSTWDEMKFTRRLASNRQIVWNGINDLESKN